MNQTHFDQSAKVLAGATGRRDAVRAFWAIGTALLAALGLTNVAFAASQHGNGGRDGRRGHKYRGKDRHRQRNRSQDRNRGNAGQQGPQKPADDETQDDVTGGGGPAGPDGTVQAAGRRNPKRGPIGPTGPTGPAGTTLATRQVDSALSNPLPVTAGTVVGVTADCEGRGKVVACGYLVSAAFPAQLVNVLVSLVQPNDDRSGCIAQLRRTTDVGSTAGAQIRATALCLS